MNGYGTVGDARKRRAEDATQHAANRDVSWRERCEELTAALAAAEAREAALRERVEKWVGIWDDNTLAALTLDQRVPIRRCRDDLSAALLTEGAESNG